MIDKNREMLVELYGRMETGRIESQIASGRLTGVGLIVASQELQRRKEGTSFTEPTAHSKISLSLIVVIAIVQILVLLSAFIFLDAEDAFLIGVVETAVMAGLVARAFPTFGMVVGSVLVVLPVGVIIAAWYKGVLSWGAYGYGMGYVLNIIIYVILFVGSTISLSIGLAMLNAARFTGTDEEFFDQTQEMRKNFWSKNIFK